MISSRTRRRSSPRSGKFRVTWRMISSKHWEKSSSRTGQMPLSLAWRSISFWSSISLSLATSILEAGWWLTYWIQCLPAQFKFCQLQTSMSGATIVLTKAKNYLPCSTHSLGGRIAFKMSSCLGLFSIGGSCPFLLEAIQVRKHNDHYSKWALICNGI